MQGDGLKDRQPGLFISKVPWRSVIIGNIISRKAEIFMENNKDLVQMERKKTFSGLQVAGIVLGTIVLTVGITLFAAWSYFFPQPFEPVTLSAAEQKQLEVKLDRLEAVGIPAELGVEERTERGAAEDLGADGRLKPQKYSEEGASREVLFTEREVNALIATNTDLADKVAVDLADNLVSARLRIPVDPDFPFFGGKTLRVRAGVEIAYRQGRPVVIVKGVSLMGVPLPNAWIGGIKNIDLVKEFSAEKGFWRAFADGVESINVEEGKLKITLKE